MWWGGAALLYLKIIFKNRWNRSKNPRWNQCLQIKFIPPRATRPSAAKRGWTSVGIPNGSPWPPRTHCLILNFIRLANNSLIIAKRLSIGRYGKTPQPILRCMAAMVMARRKQGFMAATIAAGWPPLFFHHYYYYHAIVSIILVFVGV